MQMTTHELDALAQHARKLAAESRHLLARYRAALPVLQEMVEETRQRCEQAKALLQPDQRPVS